MGNTGGLGGSVPMYHMKKIGVFISHIYGDYQNRLCSGIVKKAKEYGYRVEFFTSNDGENLGDYVAGESSILHIPRPGNYAGIILVSSTYFLSTLGRDIRNYLKDHFSCPVVDISQEESIYPRIVLENHKPVKDLVLHLGNVHHLKNICYLGSTVQAASNAMRRQVFMDGMDALSLPYEGRIFSCSFAETDISQTLDRILELTPAPEAIVCYNDKIALCVISLLKERGYHIPEQIAITGCDTLEFGQMTAPLLTSVTFPIDQVGATAVEQIFQLSRQTPARYENQPDDNTKNDTPLPVTTVYAAPSYKTSCGCPCSQNVFSYSYAKKLDQRIADLEENLILNMHMSANLQDVEDIDSGMDVLAGFVQSLEGCREFYLCLYEDWDRVSGHIRELTLTDENDIDSDTVLLKLAVRDGKRLPECTFTKRNTLPDYLYDKGAYSYIYAPLFFGEKSFGYIALSFDHDRIGYSFSFISWLLNVNNMLKSLCDKKNLGLLVGRLEDIYAKDELTGLLNRQGFKLLAAPVFEQAIADRQPVAAFMFDLDGLKQINDAFGHGEGNFAIQVLAHALESSAGETDICSRSGGDQFQILAPDCNASKAAWLIENVHKYLDNYNKLHTKEYAIQTSCGFCVQIPRSPCELVEMFETADKRMYEDKHNKRCHTS